MSSRSTRVWDISKPRRWGKEKEEERGRIFLIVERGGKN